MLDQQLIRPLGATTDEVPNFTVSAFGSQHQRHLSATGDLTEPRVQIDFVDLSWPGQLGPD